MPMWVGFLIALAVTAVCSLGGVLQKKGIGWQTKGRERDSAWRRELAIWLFGFLLVLLVPALNFIALYAISTSVLGAIGGAGVVYNLAFSSLILGEKIKLREIAVSIVLFAGIVVFAAFKGKEGSIHWSRPFFTLAWTLPVAIAAIAWLLKRGRHRLTRLYSNSGAPLLNSYSISMAAVSGALGGLMVVIIKLFQIEVFPNFLKYPLTSIMYAHITAAVFGNYAMQLAYRHGSMVVVAPISCGIFVAYPVVASWLVFSIQPGRYQIIGLIMIIASVIALSAISSMKKKLIDSKPLEGVAHT